MTTAEALSLELAQDPRPAGVDEVRANLNNPEHEQFTVTEPSDIFNTFRRLCAGKSRANVYFSNGAGSMLTSVLDVVIDQQLFIFDDDSDEARNEALATSEALAWRTALDGVKIEFVTGQAQRVRHERTPAFAVAMPDMVLRLQRRNAFRATPQDSAKPLFVAIDAPGRAGAIQRLRLLDISALGMSLLMDTTAVQLTAGMKIAKASFDLPAFGTVKCGLEIRYILSAGSDHPAHFRRCGVQFAGLSAADQVLVSRFIDDLQRSRVRTRFE